MCTRAIQFHPPELVPRRTVSFTICEDVGGLDLSGRPSIGATRVGRGQVPWPRVFHSSGVKCPRRLSAGLALLDRSGGLALAAPLHHRQSPGTSWLDVVEGGRR
jgi:hypothetical protein